MAFSPIEALRRIWTPNDDVREIFADLDPQTELDSMMRDWLCRIIQEVGTISLPLSSPNTGKIRWEVFTGPDGVSKHVTIWHVPDEMQERKAG